MPSRKEIQWSQLKVGTLVLAAVAILIFIIFLMSGSTGGLFARKLILRTYFTNASGLKNGAPVTLEGVTIGNITRIRVIPSRSPTPVEVTMQIGQQNVHDLHTDSTTAIAQAGVLGDSFVDITSVHASGPTPANNAELKSQNAPSIQDVVKTSEDALKQTTQLMGKVDTFVDTLNSTRGSAGKIINDPALYNKLVRVSTNLETLTSNINHGKGSLGKLLTDDSVYSKLNATVDELNTIASSISAGHGTAGKLVHDETLYNNINAAVANTNKLLEGINHGDGALGKLAKDPEFARKLDETVTSLDTMLKGVNDGKGTLGELVTNRALYQHTDETMQQATELVKAIRENPKKYLVIHMKIF